MRRSAVFVITLMLTCTAACGHVATYTDPKLSRASKTGILYYPPKPYLLVARTGAKDKPNDVQVIYLPDLSQPRYAVMKPGFGSSKLGLTFSNGVLVSTSQETDPKLVEAITALAGVPGSLASAAKTMAETDVIRGEASDYPVVARSIADVATDLEKISATSDATRFLTNTQLSVTSRLPAELRRAARALESPTVNESNVGAIVAQLEAAAKQLAEIKPGSENPGDSSMPFWSRIRSAEAALTAAIGKLKPKEQAPPTLSLYEVIINATGTSLKEVPMSTLPSS